MITWMQRHKKWLVITIWISTIAFVGAGFVGWGSYDYGKQGGVVAVVGDREVSVEEYQEEYSTLYDQYARIFGNTFNNDVAEKLNLKDVAFKQILQKNLILSYADSLGLDVTDEDIARELLKYKAFLKDGKFDKPTYIKVLSQNRTTPVVFEDSLKRNILLQKIQTLFDVTPNKVEVENLNKLLFVEDDINIKILNIDDIEIKIEEKELKQYWELNKNSYMSEVEYEVEFTRIPVMASNASEDAIKKHYDKFRHDYKNADGKIKSLEDAKADILKDLDKKFTKKESLKKFLKIKKSEEKLVDTAKYTLSTLPYNAENNKKISDSKVGTLIKPFFDNDSYIITKLVKKIDSKPLSFDNAREQATASYMQIAKNKKLEEIAEKEVKTFNGLNIKNVTRESIDKISGLNAQEAAKFLNDLFSATKKEGAVKLDSKVVLYRVNSSKLGEYDSAKDESVKATLSQLQDQELMNNLVKRLENTYEIQSSIEVKE